MQGDTIINKYLDMYVGRDNNNKYLDMQGETITNKYLDMQVGKDNNKQKSRNVCRERQ